MPVRTIELNPDHVMKSAAAADGVAGLQLPPFSSTATAFTKVDRFTTFLAEYTFLGSDIVMHFFPSTEVHQSSKAKAFWFQVFPEILDPVARSSFGAEPPRIEGQLIEGVTPSFVSADQAKATSSWWLCARGFTDALDPHGLVDRFFVALDRALDAANAM